MNSSHKTCEGIKSFIFVLNQFIFYNYQVICAWNFDYFITIRLHYSKCRSRNLYEWTEFGRFYFLKWHVLQSHILLSKHWPFHNFSRTVYIFNNKMERYDAGLPKKAHISQLRKQQHYTEKKRISKSWEGFLIRRVIFADLVPVLLDVEN